MFPGSFTTLSHNNAFDQLGQNDLLTYAAFNGLSNPAAAYAQLQQLLVGTNMATTGSLADNLEQNQGAYRDIKEDTAAIYISAY